MAIPKTVWGIDVGQCGLKALKLREFEGELQVDAFDIIEHPKILSQPDADKPQLIRTALEQFLARNSLADSLVAIAVPGQSSFTRFVKLPPVEGSKIPDIVRFEAEQQIPFPISDVLWRWQTFQDPDSPDVEVGIFAMKRVDVGEVLEHFSAVGMNVDIVQMAPLALYNFMKFDEHVAPEGATLLADIGADKTDLVVADGARIWTRTIQIGGNNFTEALVRAFKLSFPKAEKLKRAAASSKYARQIFQAMRPVFADLVQEIQRCIGYYTSLHRETRFKSLVGLGNGFRLPGLQKFLEQNLNIPVTRVDSYNKLVPTAAVNAPTFTENVLSFAVAYGLALQGLQLTVVNTNLLPSEVARQRVWKKKRPWFVAAASVLVLTLFGPLYRSYVDYASLETGKPLRVAQAVIAELQGLRSDFGRLIGEGEEEVRVIQRHMDLYGHRAFWPEVCALISGSIEAVVDRSQQRLYLEYAEAPDSKTRDEKRKQIQQTPRKERRVVFIESTKAEYLENVAGESAAARLPGGRTGEAPVAKGGPPKRGFWVVMVGRTPMSQSEAVGLVTKMWEESARIARGMKTVRVEDVKSVFLEGPAKVGDVGGDLGAPTGKRPDPFLPNEDASGDAYFAVGWLLSIEGDGVEKITIGN